MQMSASSVNGPSLPWFGKGETSGSVNQNDLVELGTGRPAGATCSGWTLNVAWWSAKAFNGTGRVADMMNRIKIMTRSLRSDCVFMTFVSHDIRPISRAQKALHDPGQLIKHDTISISSAMYVPPDKE